jgi:hypothetical protein
MLTFRTIAAIGIMALLLGSCKYEKLIGIEDAKIIGVNDTTYLVDGSGNIFEHKDGYFIEIPKFSLKALTTKKSYNISKLAGLPLNTKIEYSYRNGEIVFDANTKAEYATPETLSYQPTLWPENCKPLKVSLVWDTTLRDKSFHLPLEYVQALKTLGDEVPSECLASPEFETAYKTLRAKAVSMIDYNKKLEGILQKSSTFYGASAPFNSITLIFRENGMHVTQTRLSYGARLKRNLDTSLGFGSEGKITSSPADFLRINEVSYQWRANKALVPLIKELNELEAQFQ